MRTTVDGVDRVVTITGGTAFSHDVTCEGLNRTYITGSNKLINGKFAVAQRATTAAGTGYRTVDRWSSVSTGTVTQNTTLANLPTGFSSGITLSATAVGANHGVRQGIELDSAGQRGIYTVGSTWTLTYYATQQLLVDIRFRDDMLQLM